MGGCGVKLRVQEFAALVNLSPAALCTCTVPDVFF